jgi:hypothetical protein
MRKRNRAVRSAYPILVIIFGVILMVTKQYYYSIAGPFTEGPIVFGIGILFCAFGCFGLIGTLMEFRRNDDSPPPEYPPDFN